MSVHLNVRPSDPRGEESSPSTFEPENVLPTSEERSASLMSLTSPVDADACDVGIEVKTNVEPDLICGRHGQIQPNLGLDVCGDIPTQHLFGFLALEREIDVGCAIGRRPVRADTGEEVEYAASRS